MNIGNDVRGGNIVKRNWLHVEGDSSVVRENASNVFQSEYSLLEQNSKDASSVTCVPTVSDEGHHHRLLCAGV